MNHRTLLGTLLGAFSAVLLAACGSGGAASAPSSQTTNAPATTPVATLATSASTATPAATLAAATPASNPVDRVSGTVQSFDGQKVSLSDGSSFTVSSATSLTRRQNASPSVLKPGAVVAITAKRQPDNTLSASMVVVFDKAPNFRLGQSNLPSGDLMTNATVQSVQGNNFSVTFPGGGAQVALAPNAQIDQVISATTSDLTPGTMVSAAVNSGVAQSVTIQ